MNNWNDVKKGTIRNSSPIWKDTRGVTVVVSGTSAWLRILDNIWSKSLEEREFHPSKFCGHLCMLCKWYRFQSMCLFGN